MKKRRFLKVFKWLHQWLGLIAAIFIFCWSISGIILNHRETFSSLSIDRSILAKEYQYNNWNNASLRSSCKIGNDSILLYGNIGVWLCNESFSSYKDFNNGFPKGIDNRKVSKVYLSKNNNLLAATLFGLYQYNWKLNQWKKLELPNKEKRIVGITQAKDSLYVMSRSYLFTSLDRQVLNFNERNIPAPVDYDNKIGLFKTLWVIHSGEIYGQLGILIVDLVAIIFIFLTITGLLYYFVPGIIKRRKRQNKDNAKVKRLNKISIKWHNKIGIYIVILLIITTLTGMFLRPPLLIAIANSRVGKIPFTTLDKSNPWYDRFRDILYDKDLDRFLIGTVEGIYFSEDHFKSSLSKPRLQPPISVMGINVFEQKGRGDYLVGSFLGLYRWMPDYGFVQNYITRSRDVTINPSGPPLGKYMSSGYLELQNSQAFHIDYNYGILPIVHNNAFVKMPDEIIKNSPMSLWNFALEIHTARFFKFLFGKFYILIVPLLGVFVLTILVTGLVVWIKLFIRRK